MKEIRICLKQSRCEHTDRLSDAVSQSAIKKNKTKEANEDRKPCVEMNWGESVIEESDCKRQLRQLKIQPVSYCQAVRGSD